MQTAAYNQYQACIEACLRCAALCNHCASSCLQEEDVKMMAACVQRCMECAAICYATAQLMSLGSSQVATIATICAEICDACVAECGSHDDEHCRTCAEACRNCAGECRRMSVG